MTSEGYSTALYVYNDQRKVKCLIFLKLSMKFVYHTICQGIRKKRTESIKNKCVLISIS